MVSLLVDTNILVDLLRNYPPATKWLNALGNTNIGISSIVYMEIIQGAPNKAELSVAIRFLAQFELIIVNDRDQQWAIRQLIKYNLSHHIDLNDALIASSAYRLQLPLYTRNLKHFTPIIPDLVKQPY
ncbi:MAG: type II toxin-antitoxin system VapC family toxin [Chloroflexota bacterium]